MTGSDKTSSHYLRIAAGLFLLAAIAALFIGGAQPFAINLIPAPWDKVAHVCVFALVGATIGLASGLRGIRMALFAFAGAVLLGSLDELHQGWLPGRNAGMDDLAADMLGGLLGATVLVVRQRLQKG